MVLDEFSANHQMGAFFGEIGFIFAFSYESEGYSLEEVETSTCVSDVEHVTDTTDVDESLADYYQGHTDHRHTLNDVRHYGSFEAPLKFDDANFTQTFVRIYRTIYSSLSRVICRAATLCLRARNDTWKIALTHHGREYH